MFKHPEIASNDKNYIKAVNMAGIFNFLLEENLVAERHSYILSVDSLQDSPTNFKTNGKLSTAGIDQHWCEIDEEMKRFDRCQLELYPISKCDKRSTSGEGDHPPNADRDVRKNHDSPEPGNRNRIHRNHHEQ